MSKGVGLYRKKISVCMEVLAKVFAERLVERANVARLLREYYEASGVKPFMGAKLREDLYDKEMATLYVVARYGMGLNEEDPETFQKVFFKELLLERAAEALLSPDVSPEEKRLAVRHALGMEPDSNELSRVFRVVFTKVLFGFETEERLSRLLAESIRAYPEQRRTVENFAKFYIAFRIAEKLSAGEISSKLEKEVEKQAINLRLGLGFTLPDDRYIYVISRNVFGLSEKRLEKVLSMKGRREGEGGEGGKRSGG